MKIEQLRGATVALVTPFEEDGALDEKALRRLVEWQVEQGIDAILALGTTGESVTLSEEERSRVIDLVLDQVDRRCAVLCGTGTNSTADSIRRSQQAVRAGCDAILVVGPYYNKPTQEGYFRHFEAIAESTSVPLIAYNVPSRTGSNISAETILRLARIPSVAGVKEASGSLTQIMAILERRPKDFLVLAGDDSWTLPMLALGGDGVISVAANEAPGLMSEMVREAFHGNWERARQLHFRLLPLMEVNFVETNPIPVKAALAMMGRISDQVRLPLTRIGEENRRKVRSVLESLELL